ncbi:MAG TPA: alpha/beta hydrolase [Victivallales bacterium]|nr:alpha/beta hydrolase [Victivallales bacterium]
MTRIDSIKIAPEHGFRGEGDLFLPENPLGAPVAIVIHGGGWTAMDKTTITPFSLLLTECGYAAFSVNYRLLNDAPWPACGDDCLRSTEFLLSAGHPAMKELDRSRILILGASAGGHLALWTGLNLPPEKVRAIISIAGPSNLIMQKDKWDKKPEFWGKFLGGAVTDEKLMAASPVTYVKSGVPRLLCIHSTNDKLVLPEQSRFMIDAYAKVNAEAELFIFPGKRTNHGIWTDGSGEVSKDKRIIVPEVRSVISSFLKRI